MADPLAIGGGRIALFGDGLCHPLGLGVAELRAPHPQNAVHAVEARGWVVWPTCCSVTAFINHLADTQLFVLERTFGAMDFDAERRIPCRKTRLGDANCAVCIAQRHHRVIFDGALAVRAVGCTHAHRPTEEVAGQIDRMAQIGDHAALGLNGIKKRRDQPAIGVFCGAQRSIVRVAYAHIG